MVAKKPKKITSKKHLARLERERRQVKIITYAAIAVIFLVVALGIFSWLNATVFQNIRPIVRVEQDVVTTREFQFRVRVARMELINQYIYIEQLAQMFNIDPSSDTYMSEQINQVLAQLADPISLGATTIDKIIDELLIRQEAKRRNITVSKEEVEELIQSTLHYFPNGTPTVTITPTRPVYATLSAQQLSLVTPTSTFVPTAAVVATNTPTPTNTSDPNTTPTSTPTNTPTATPYTRQAYENNLQAAFENSQILGLTEEDYYQLNENIIFRQKVFEAITADTPAEQEMVWARHILVDSLDEAKLVLSLLNNGVDWNYLVQEYSKDESNKSKGGDLGWFGRGEMVTEFETAAFALNIGEISEAVQTSYGYHIIQTLGHEMHPLDASQYQAYREKIFQNWLAEARQSAQIQLSDYWVDFIPEDPTLNDVLNQIYGQ